MVCRWCLLEYWFVHRRLLQYQTANFLIKYFDRQSSQGNSIRSTGKTPAQINHFINHGDAWLRHDAHAAPIKYRTSPWINSRLASTLRLHLPFPSALKLPESTELLLRLFCWARTARYCWSRLCLFWMLAIDGDSDIDVDGIRFWLFSSGDKSMPQPECKNGKEKEKAYFIQRTREGRQNLAKRMKRANYFFSG